jgi:LysM repeat protein
MRADLDPNDPAGATLPAPGGSDQADGPSIPLPQMPPGTAALDVVCPYLRSADGTWRSTRPQREHRCWAQAPPAPLSTLTQSQLCLTTAHPRCTIYGAALQRRSDELARDRIAPERLSGARFGALVQPVPLTMDPTAERLLPSPSTRPMRLVGTLLVGLLAVAVLAGGIYVVASQFAAAPPVTGLASPTPNASIPAAPEPSSTTTAAAPTNASTPLASPAASPPPALTPTPPAIVRTYRVRAGDTLRSIARRFGVTRAAIRAINHLGAPPVLTPGQLINIPARSGPAG